MAPSGTANAGALHPSMPTPTSLGAMPPRSAMCRADRHLHGVSGVEVRVERETQVLRRREHQGVLARAVRPDGVRRVRRGLLPLPLLRVEGVVSAALERRLRDPGLVEHAPGRRHVLGSRAVAARRQGDLLRA